MLEERLNIGRRVFTQEISKEKDASEYNISITTVVNYVKEYMEANKISIVHLWFLCFRQERRIDCYAENEQETETRVGVVSELKKSHYLQRTLQKMQQ